MCMLMLRDVRELVSVVRNNQYVCFVGGVVPSFESQFRKAVERVTQQTSV